MSKKRSIQDPQGGFLQGFILQTKLILRLMGDREVPFLLKLLPVGALIYLVSPVDLVPGLVLPVIGALDDAAVIWLGFTLFVSLCPDHVVQKHHSALEKVLHGSWRDAPEDASTAIVEAGPRDEESA
ncbi:MAG: hypothetical protein FD146_1531 [Anaerolineaceae bacterium]|nr:MAG: hypothetical protein FD146_1531 [Anaerolineaceae bacterium]